jgi:hypothetical protein
MQEHGGDAYGELVRERLGSDSSASPHVRDRNKLAPAASQQEH